MEQINRVRAALRIVQNSATAALWGRTWGWDANGHKELLKGQHNVEVPSPTPLALELRRVVAHKLGLEIERRITKAHEAEERAKFRRARSSSYGAAGTFYSHSDIGAARRTSSYDEKRKGRKRSSSMERDSGGADPALGAAAAAFAGGSEPLVPGPWAKSQFNTIEDTVYRERQHDLSDERATVELLNHRFKQKCTKRPNSLSQVQEDLLAQRNESLRQLDDDFKLVGIKGLPQALAPYCVFSKVEFAEVMKEADEMHASRTETAPWKQPPHLSWNTVVMDIEGNYQVAAAPSAKDEVKEW